MCIIAAPRVRIKILIIGKKKKRNLQNDARIKTCIEQYDNAAFLRLRFARALGLGAYPEAFQFTSDDKQRRRRWRRLYAVSHCHCQSRRICCSSYTPQPDMCEVCLVAPRSGVALVPYGHSRFCFMCVSCSRPEPPPHQPNPNRVRYLCFLWHKQRLTNVVFLLYKNIFT